ncbi:MAG: DUF1353 domain-containing protein [Aquisalinus sp.]|nr:DUF1353 domain-containing protein [Aquisalinus sp.]
MKPLTTLTSLIVTAGLVACSTTPPSDETTESSPIAARTVTSAPSEEQPALPAELVQLVAENPTPDDAEAEMAQRSDPFGIYERERALKDDILFQEQRALIDQFRELSEAKQEPLTRRERRRLTNTFNSLVDLVMENLLFEGRDEETDEILYDYIDLDDDFSLSLNQRRLTQSEALEILCFSMNDNKQLNQSDCALAYTVIPTKKMNARWNSDINSYEIPVTDFPDDPATIYPQQLAWNLEKNRIVLPNSDFYYGEMYIFGTFTENGDLTFELGSIVPPPAAAPPPAQMLSAALQDLYSQLSVVSDEDDDQDLLRDGIRRNFVLKEDLLYCREATGEIFLIPAGFVTDLLSVKGMSAFLRSDRTYAGAIIHDWLFAIGGGEAERKRAEAMFSEELRFNKSGALRRFFITMGTDKVGPLYFRLFGKDSPFGRRAEMRFATKESCDRGYALQAGDEPYIRGILNQDEPIGKRCAGFQENYADLFEKYATDTRINTRELTSDDEKRAYLRSVIVNKDPNKSCADL